MKNNVSFTLPMITIVGAFFWLLALAAVWQLLRIGRESFRRQWLELALLILGALFVFCRPHEDIFGGEDPGSYLNSGVTYNRRQQLFFVDELLAQVPPEVRPCFYYGHAGYGLTKDACLWVRNADLAMVGPHFQPAYPLLIALAARIGNETGALLVAPLFAVFTALALRALALLTIPWRWAGLIAFLFYILNPLAIWHGRGARPEIIAVFMFSSGLALMLRAWQNQNWKKTADLIIGALCIGLAPLFHVTAWLLVIPAGLLALMLILRGRDDFLLYGLLAGLTAGLFYLETIHITDYYALRRFFEIVFSHPWRLAAAFSLLAVISLGVKKYFGKDGRAGAPWPSRPKTGCHGPTPPELASWLRPSFAHRSGLREGGRLEEAALPLKRVSLSLYAGLLLGAIVIALLAVLVFNRRLIGDLPLLGLPVQHYFFLTDFRVVANMLSWPVMLLILAGLLAWLTGPASGRKYRLAVLIVFLPAGLLAGNIHDFMMTRYLLVAFIPLATLLLAALIVFIIPRSRAGGPAALWAALLLCAIIGALGLNKRLPLVTTVEHQGFCRFLRPYAETIKANKGMLLCEYSRIAAPLEHFFGVPTLGLDNERQNNYEQAEKAWAGIMAARPEQPAFFMTPYHSPLSAYFDFEPVFSNSFQDCRLEQARQGLPTRVGRSLLTLRLFRMKLKPPQPAPAKMLGAVLAPDAGNMGLRNFANLRQEPLPPQENYFPSAALEALALPENTRKQAEALLGLPRPAIIPARWTRAQAEVLLPSVPRIAGLLLVHLRAPDPDKSGFVTLQLTRNGEKIGEPRRIPSEKWQWQVWPLPPAAPDSSQDVAWFGLNTAPAWNPGKPNFPTDLGILISRIICLPVYSSNNK